MAKNIADMIRSCMDAYCEKLYEKYGDNCEDYCAFCNENGDCCIHEADDFVKKAWEKEYVKDIGLKETDYDRINKEKQTFDKSDSYIKAVSEADKKIEKSMNEQAKIYHKASKFYCR